MKQPQISNALLRLQCSGSQAEDLFELVNEEHYIWVKELEESYSMHSGLADQLEDIVSELDSHSETLKKLRARSKDYTLHLTVSGDESSQIMLPMPLLELAVACGFEIEVYRWDHDA